MLLISYLQVLKVFKYGELVVDLFAFNSAIQSADRSATSRANTGFEQHIVQPRDLNVFTSTWQEVPEIRQRRVHLLSGQVFE